MDLGCTKRVEEQAVLMDRVRERRGSRAARMASGLLGSEEGTL